MISELIGLIDLLLKYRVWGVVLILFLFVLYLFRIIIDEDRSTAFRALYYRIVYRLSGKSEAERKYIESDICSRINLARRKMPFGKDYLPRAIKIKWVEGGRGESDLVREGDLIVRLDPIKMQEKNIVIIARRLVEQTSLVGIRHILNEPLEISMDLNLIRILLLEINDRKILDWFFRNEYYPCTKKSGDIKEFSGKIFEISEKGLFTRLLLVELDDYSRRVMGKPFCPRMLDEITRLVEFLFKIATRGYDQRVPLEYISENIKIGVIIVGKTGKIIKEITPYLTAFAYEMSRKETSIYVIRSDKELLKLYSPKDYRKFIEMSEKLEYEIEKLFKLHKDFELKYSCKGLKGKKMNSKITRYIPEFTPQVNV